MGEVTPAPVAATTSADEGAAPTEGSGAAGDEGAADGSAAEHGAGGPAGPDGDAPTGDGAPERAGWVGELLLGLEVAALAALTFSRPILDTFGRSPETFIARHATTTDIVLFGLVVAFVPALGFAALGSLTRVFGKDARRWSHLVLVMVLGGLAAWRFGRDVTGWPNDATKLILAGLLVGPLLALLRWRVPATGTFLRYAGMASVIFLLQFLAMSPTSDMVFGGPPSVDAEVEDQVAAGLGDDPPSVVLVVLDALPTASLLDGQGRVDAELYPNIAELAGTSTWYRNDTSVAAFTGEAVPALLTGRYPNGRPKAPDPENLFTLLGGNYDLHVKEQVTRLCPDELCPRGASAGVGQLVDDAATWWKGSGSDEPRNEFDLPAVLEDGRYDAAEEWIDDLHVSPGGRPDLTFLHVVLPHAPSQFTPDGRLYDMQTELPVGSAGLGWTQAGYAVGLQRHVLQAQAADRLVGQLMDRLREDGVFDDSVVMLTADHGEAFVPDSLGRAVDADNIPYIMWTPLFVKAPGQTEPAVDDANIQSIDVLPTIADMLGVEMPWDVDGLPVAEARAERDDVKRFDDDDFHEIHAAEGEHLLEIDGPEHFPTVLASDPVSATGPDAVWRRTPYGDLFGQSSDDVDVGDPLDTTLSVEHPQRLDDIDTSEPLPLETVGYADLDVGTTVAIALNGTIGGLTTVEPWGDPGRLVHAMLPPDLFEDGANELAAYVVEGPPTDPVLRPLDLDLGGS